MNKDLTGRITVLSVLFILMLSAVTVMNRFDSGHYMAEKTQSDIVSCTYTEIGDVRGGHYSIDLRASDDGKSSEISIHSSDSEYSEDVVKHFSSAPEALNVTKQLIDLYGFKSGNSRPLTEPENFDEYDVSTLLVRYSDDSVLYADSQNLNENQKSNLLKIKDCLLSYASNSNSRLTLEKNEQNSPVFADSNLDLRTEFYEDGYLTVYVTNHTSQTKEYSTDFTLEISSGDSWEKNERLTDYSISSAEYSINDMQVFSHVLDLNAYGTLSPGTYRVSFDEEISAEFVLR